MYPPPLCRIHRSTCLGNPTTLEQVFKFIFSYFLNGKFAIYLQWIQTDIWIQNLETEPKFNLFNLNRKGGRTSVCGYKKKLKRCWILWNAQKIFKKCLAKIVFTEEFGSEYCGHDHLFCQFFGPAQVLPVSVVGLKCNPSARPNQLVLFTGDVNHLPYLSSTSVS